MSARVDGRIARPDGDLEWLTSRGAAAGDAGFTPFVESVDAVVMRRGTYGAIAPDVRTAVLDGGMVQTTYRVLGGPTP